MLPVTDAECEDESQQVNEMIPLPCAAVRRFARPHKSGVNEQRDATAIYNSTTPMTGTEHTSYE
ncbi:MAG: hypothetical protein JNL32_06725 [Candidatus Kapabacteria bacterium]|nr:hypothetical protein [Candidatus Kapabacteria bacterium]